MKPITIESKSIDDLLFDPDNPRLPEGLRSAKENEVIEWMLKDASILELMGSIGEKDFFPAEPLLVVPSKKNSKKFIVVEGNRRLTAVKLLHNPELAGKKKKASIASICNEAKIKPSSLPVIVYAKREEILDYLGFKHITGVRPWSALAKAKYVSQLREDYLGMKVSEQYKKLAKAIGSRADYVKELLIGLEVYGVISENSFFNIDGLDEETIDFGVYYNALKYANVATFLGIDKLSDKPTRKLVKKNLEELTRWLSQEDANHKTRLGESRNLSKLNAVLSEKKALAMFRSGHSLENAIIFTDEPDKLFRNSLITSWTNLQEANKSLHSVSNSQHSDLDTLKDLLSLSESMIVQVEHKMNKSGKKGKHTQ